MSSKSPQVITLPEPSLTVADAIERAVSAAAPLEALKPRERASILDAVADALDADAARLVEIADRETSLGRTRLSGEMARTTGQLRLFGTVLRDGGYLEVTIDHADPSSSPPTPDLRRWLEPLGPVAVFTASNFPFAFSVAGGDTASALAAGCPVVVKAHSGHPELSRATASVVLDALARVGAPHGTLTHVEGREAGRELVKTPEIKAVSFTGSLSGGRALFDLAVSRDDPIPFYGELGSINPVVVSPQAARVRAPEIAKGLAESFTLGVGQFCTKPGVVFVPEAIDLSANVVEAASKHPSAPMLTQRILSSFRQGTSELAACPGVDLVGGWLQDGADDGARPLVFASDVKRLLTHPELLLREHFGPAVLLIRYGSSDELIDGIDVLPGSLTATLHAEAEEAALLAPVLDRLRRLAGRVILNGWPTGVAVTWPMQHGGPWPATTNPLHTSVGATAVRRFLRPIAYQDMTETFLPLALRDDNALGLPRRVDGRVEE